MKKRALLLAVLLSLGLLIPFLGSRTQAAGSRNPSTTTTLGAYLESYWGERWAEVSRQKAFDDVDLAQLVDPAATTPWSQVEVALREDFLVLSEAEVQAHVADAVAWPHHEEMGRAFEYSDPLWNPDARSLSASQRKTLDKLMRRYDEDLAALGRWKAEAFHRATTRIWADRSYWVSPYVSLAPPQDLRPTMLARFYEFHPWQVGFVLRKGDAPEFEAVLQEIHNLQQERLIAVQRFFRELG